MITVSVEKNENENTTSLIRRFSRRVQGSGVVRRAKGIRFHARAISKTKRRTSAVRRLRRTEDMKEKELLGLIIPRTRGRGRGR